MTPLVAATPVTPGRSYQQQLESLGKANHVRAARAQVKRDLAAGRIDWLQVLDHPDCQTMRILTVLLAMPRVGRVKAERMLQRARVSPSKTCGGLTHRQRSELQEIVTRHLPVPTTPRRHAA